MNNTGLEFQLSDKKKYLILDGSAIPSTLDKHEIEWIKSLHHDMGFVELLEHYLCNGWSTTSIACFGGLVLESPDGVLYADVKHQTHNAVERLLEGKKYHFHRTERDG